MIFVMIITVTGVRHYCYRTQSDMLCVVSPGGNIRIQQVMCNIYGYIVFMRMKLNWAKSFVSFQIQP